MTIGQLSKETGFTIETIRYYESIGVLPEPKRREAGYRNYSREYVPMLGFVKRAKEFEFTLAEIKEMLGSNDCADFCALTREKLNEVQEKIEFYKNIQQKLTKLLSACTNDFEKGCEVITSLKT